MAIMQTTIVSMTALVLSGCMALDPASQAPSWPSDMPAQWQSTAPAAAEPVNQSWWRSFGSEQLSQTIEKAQIQSLDMAAAMARVQQARAHARHAEAGMWPEMNGSVGAAQESAFKHRAQGSVSQWSAGLTASYEVDFWGRQREANSAAQSTWQASVFERDTVRLTVEAAVAHAWFQCVSWQERAGIAQQNLTVAQRLLQVVESKARWGAATRLDVAQQRGLVAAQQREVARMVQQQADAQAELALLSAEWETGCSFPPGLQSLNVPHIEPTVPALLLARRPDIARSEALLSAAHADLQAARAAMLPRITLTAGITAQSSPFSQILRNPLHTLAAGLITPIFDAGRLAAQRDGAAAHQQALLVGYQQSIMQAFNDVQLALNASAGLHQQAVAQAEELAQAHQALALAEVRYRYGAQTLTTLLNTQSALYQANDMALALHQQRLSASVDFYKALGGGWERTYKHPQDFSQVIQEEQW